MEAIKQINEIKSKRQAAFVMRRLREATAIEQRRDAQEVKTNLSLIRAPGASKFIPFCIRCYQLLYSLYHIRINFFSVSLNANMFLKS